MDMETLLYEEIEADLRGLKDMQVDDESYKLAAGNVAVLMDRAIELEKLKLEQKEKALAREEDRKDRLVKNCLAAAGILIPSVITIWGTCKSIEFEKEGTITTIMGRGFINKLLPKK